MKIIIALFAVFAVAAGQFPDIWSLMTGGLLNGGGLMNGMRNMAAAPPIFASSLADGFSKTARGFGQLISGEPQQGQASAPAQLTPFAQSQAYLQRLQQPPQYPQQPNAAAPDVNYQRYLDYMSTMPQHAMNAANGFAQGGADAMRAAMSNMQGMSASIPGVQGMPSISAIPNLTVPNAQVAAAQPAATAAAPAPVPAP